MQALTDYVGLFTVPDFLHAQQPDMWARAAGNSGYREALETIKQFIAPVIREAMLNRAAFVEAVSGVVKDLSERSEGH